MSAPPRLYAEWAAALERFAAGDDDVLAAMEAGTLEWTAGAAERFTRRLHDAFFARVKDAERRLQRDLDHARGDEALLARALVAVRHALAPLARLARLPTLPEAPRAHLEGELKRLVDSINSSLESSARADRLRGERLLATVRANAVRLPAPADAAPAPGDGRGASAAPPPGARRSIIL
ncbi:MAG TPA: hypothetical protein VF615_04165 [Longimicrobiaceae bacterium]